MSAIYVLWWSRTKKGRLIHPLVFTNHRRALATAKELKDFTGGWFHIILYKAAIVKYGDVEVGLKCEVVS